MKTFLAQVATNIYNKYGDNMENLCMIFPSRRVRVFFEQELSELISRPIWQPIYKSIDDLVQQLSVYSRAEELKLLAKLHEVYSRYHQQDFDKFYRWGLMLIADFDTIDKYMIDASKLYANISDIKEIDSFFDDYEDIEKELIYNFWSTFRKEQAQSEQERVFVNIWSSLGAIYKEFQQELASEGIAYSGMQYRELAQRITAAKSDADVLQVVNQLGFMGMEESESTVEFCFVGFNALSRSETEILGFMQKTMKNASFYWDYDSYYMPIGGAKSSSSMRQAGRFVTRNLMKFGQQNSIECDNFNQSKHVEVIETPSDVMQCKALYYKLIEICDKQGFVDRETAIVLTDEQLLGPVLASVPECVDKINVTMGCRLADTIPYLFVDKILELELSNSHRGYYYRSLSSILNHAYLRGELAKGVERRLSDMQYVYVGSKELITIIDQLYSEFTADHSSKSGAQDQCAENVKEDLSLNYGLSDIELLTKQKELMKALFEQGCYDNIAERLNNILGLCGKNYLINQLKYDNALADGEEGFVSESLLDIAQEQLYMISVIVGEISSLESSVAQCGLDAVSAPMYARLLRKRLKTTKIPYSGEPLEGLQIMGILETRCLDFKNVIYLSMTDDNFPGAIKGGSYIPVNLRQAFGLPSISDHEAVYAYYFYRSIQRCENLVMMYCSSSEGVKSGEQSRYIYQLTYDSVHKVHRRQVLLSGVASQGKDFGVKKTDEIIEKLKNHTFSASQINTYITCPMKFYLSSIARIKKNEEVQEQASSLDMGNIFHKSMELLYLPIMDKANHRAEISKIDKNQIRDAVSQAVLSVVGERGRAGGGSVKLCAEVVERYVSYVIRYDAAISPNFRIVGIEQKFNCELSGMKIRGVIDRVDRMENGDLRVIDYKTGRSYKNVLKDDLGNMFEAYGSTKQNSAALQTAIYARALRENGEKADIYASLYVCAKMYDNSFDPTVTIKQYKELSALVLDTNVCDELDLRLDALNAKIHNSDLDFECCEDKKVCQNCEFISICEK